MHSLYSLFRLYVQEELGPRTDCDNNSAVSLLESKANRSDYSLPCLNQAVSLCDLMPFQ